MTEKDKHEHDKPAPAHVTPPPPPAPASKEPPAGGSKGASGQPAVALPPEAYMTEQEKAALKPPAAKKEADPADKKETK